MALQQVQQELETEGSSRQAVTVHLSGALHSDKRRAFKFVARKLCEHCDMKFVSSASVEENEAFLRQVLAHMGRCRALSLFYATCICITPGMVACGAGHQVQYHSNTCMCLQAQTECGIRVE